MYVFMNPFKLNYVQNGYANFSVKLSAFITDFSLISLLSGSFQVFFKIKCKALNKSMYDK